MSFKSRLQKIANWFQPTYNKIQAWELSPELQKTFDSLWNSLNPSIQKAMWAVLDVFYKKYGKEKAKELLKLLLEYLSKVLNVSDNK